MDERKRKLQLELEAAQAGLNATSKEIGLLMAKGDKAGADEKKEGRDIYKIRAWTITAGAGPHRIPNAAVTVNPSQPSCIGSPAR
ncbi:MAG: hypothetical protein WDM78_22215 [Puia sp.]